MSVIYLLIPISIVIATVFLVGFIWAVRSGQYEDTCTPSLRLLTEDPSARSQEKGTTDNRREEPISNNQKTNQR